MDTSHNKDTNIVSEEALSEIEKRILERYRGRVIMRASEKNKIGKHQIQNNDRTGAAKWLFLDRITQVETSSPLMEAAKDRFDKTQDGLEKIMLDYMWESFSTVGRRGEELQRIMTENRAFLKFTLQLNGNENNEDSASYQAAIDKAQAEYDKLKKLSPEGYTYVRGKELLEYHKQIENDRGALVPSMRGVVEQVIDYVDHCRPIFVKGPTGGGKTLAVKEAAVIAAIERAALKDAEQSVIEEMDKIKQKILDEAKQKASDSVNDEAAVLEYVEEKAKNYAEQNRDKLWKHFGTAYAKKIKEYSNDYNKHKPGIRERFTPEFLTCTFETNSRDLFASDTLELDIPNNATVHELYEAVDADVRTWIQNHPEEATDEDKLNQIRNEILQYHIAKSSQHGSVVKTNLGPVARAMQEGKPVILDEVNFASTEVMASLHEALTAHPGDSIEIKGVDHPIVVQPGFVIIMTGNESDDFHNYLATHGFNLATANRKSDIKYGYPTMSEEKASEKNELFHITIAKLLDKNGNLTLPDIARTTEKLFNLCRLANATQQIFEGKWSESRIRDDNETSHDIELDSSPMTVRDIMAILDNWNTGLKKDLDQAIWDEFITRYNGVEQSLMIQLAKKYFDFFKEDDGWDFSKFKWGTEYTIENARPDRERFIGLRVRKMDTKPLYDVVRMLFGEDPKRKYPKITFEDIARLEEERRDDAFGEEQEAEIDKKMEDMEKTISALEALYHCGCEVVTT